MCYLIALRTLVHSRQQTSIDTHWQCVCTSMDSIGLLFGNQSLYWWKLYSSERWWSHFYFSPTSAHKLILQETFAKPFWFVLVRNIIIIITRQRWIDFVHYSRKFSPSLTLSFSHGSWPFLRWCFSTCGPSLAMKPFLLMDRCFTYGCCLFLVILPEKLPLFLRCQLCWAWWSLVIFS